MQDNVCFVESGENKIKITYSDETKKNLVCIPCDDKIKYKWIDKLNIQCIINGFDLETVKNKILKFLSRQVVCEEKQDLQKFIVTSVSFINVLQNSSTKKFSNKNIIANMIIDEYISNKTKLNKNTTLNLHENNIYKWDVLMKINNGKIESKIKIEICFHDELYPNYPPYINIKKPELENDLNLRIASSKMVNLNYWTPTRNTAFIIERIYNILEKYGIETTNENQKIKENSLNIDELKFDEIINKLMSFNLLNGKKDDEIDLDYKFINFAEKNKTNTNTKKEVKNIDYWKSGTGYGHYNSVFWNIDEYKTAKIERDNLVLLYLQDLNNILFKISDNFIRNSYLKQYLSNFFECFSLLDVEETYFQMTNIIEIVKKLFERKIDEIFLEGKKPLYEIFKKNYDMFSTFFEKSKNNLFFEFLSTYFISNIFKKYNHIYELKCLDIKEEKKENNPKNIYKNIMVEKRFTTTKIKNFSYKINEKLEQRAWIKCQKRLSTEIPSIIQFGQLPIEYDSSIFLVVDENNPMMMKALITGPKNTPYDSGCFIFDIFMDENYPLHPPKITFLNTGSKRFNPNLYESGKVCLSILGTWHSSQESEKWNSTSSLLQVLISIQSLIFIEEPYFNEPGYEKQIGTLSGKNSSEYYNSKIRTFTMMHAVFDLLNDKTLYPEFRDIIDNHFVNKKEYILEKYKSWCSIDSKIYDDISNCFTSGK